MDFFRSGEVSSLDRIGITYEEPRHGYSSSSITSTFGLDSDGGGRQSPPPPRDAAAGLNRTLNRTSSTVDDFTDLSSLGMPAGTTPGRRRATSPTEEHDGVSGPVHMRGNSTGITFSGQPADVVRFRSCIPFNAYGRSRRGGILTEPQQSGPFSADVFSIILLFLDVRTHNAIVEVGNACVFWRHYANLAPHWTYFRRKEWHKHKMDIPKYIRRAVMKPKVVTRDEYIAERVKVEDCKKRDRLIGTAKHVRWCVAMAIMVGAMVTANYVVAYFLGFLRTALRSDVNLAITTFVLMSVMSVLQLIVVIIPLGGMSSNTSSKDTMMRILSWGIFLFTSSVVFGVISALAFTRVQAEGHVLDGSIVDLTMNASCFAYASKELPSFALLSAALSDVRWRPITMDDTEQTFIPYCINRRADDKNNVTQQCYTMLFFDAMYTSRVFNNNTELKLYKNVGTRTANGFDPTEGALPYTPWCSLSQHPQVVALSTVLYETVRAQRDLLYPAPQQWLDAAVRKQTFGTISQRCSSDINRETTEDPRWSTDVWYDRTQAWKAHYVPLLSTLQQTRTRFQWTHDHFLKYAFVCYIITGIMWVVLLFGQCILRSMAATILGITTTIALVFMNPVTLIVSGALCHHVSDDYFMCNSYSGGAMIGGGVSMIFLLAMIYVSMSG